MIKVVLLDVDNTLLSFDEYVKESMKNGFERFGIGRYRDDMITVFNRVNAGLWKQLEQGQMSFDELQKIRWNRIFESLGLAGDGVAFEKYFSECLFESAIPEPGAMELLKYLNGKYTLCAASNGPYDQQVNRLKISGMLPYFSHLFISEEVGFSKPSKEFFDVCVSRINVGSRQAILPSEMMIIGDSLSSDIFGGMQAGMQACYYNPAGNQLPDGLKPNYSLSSLREIKTIL